MKIVFCAAEAAPFAKVGGLGDVVGSLPKALAALGEDVMVCLPRYGCMSPDDYTLLETGVTLDVPYQGETYRFRVLESTLPGSSVPIWFFENDALFGRILEVYPPGNPAFEALRFEVFGEAVFHGLKTLAFQPKVLHLHDWHTSPMAPALSQRWCLDPFFASTRSVLTLHNLAYQGEINGVNRLQEGLHHSDALIAVSPTYAKEILTSVGGAGLEGVLQSQRHKLHGILNGLDTTLFNPATDPFLPQRYDSMTVEGGKRACQQTLRMDMGLPLEADVPVIGMVTRLVEQKGLDILLEALPTLATMPLQLAILGSGEAHYEDALRAWNAQSPNIRTRLGYNAALGQHIYAGSDLFLMPSRFEPCGLGQMIALRYGTSPIVRKTGGLADTVIDLTEHPTAGTGFVFEPYTAHALIEAVERALTCWREQSQAWRALVQRGMAQDWSWAQSARAYQRVYQSVCQQAMQRT